MKKYSITIFVIIWALNWELVLGEIANLGRSTDNEVFMLAFYVWFALPLWLLLSYTAYLGLKRLLTIASQ